MATSPGDGDLDYLYEDDPGRGRGRWAIAFLILAAFGAFIAYQWNQFPNWYTAIVKPISSQSQASQSQPAPSQASPDQSKSGAAPNPASNVSASEPVQPAGSSSSASPAAKADPAKSDPVAPSSPAGAAATSASSGATPAPASPPLQANNAPSTAGVNPGRNQNNAPQSDAEPADTVAEVNAEPPKPVTHGSGAKPTAAVALEPHSDGGEQLLARGQAYLYGKGVPRSCSQALMYLNSAADRGSAKANSQLAGLYATGHCVTLDRARAYDYFTRAQQAEHGRNVYIQHNRAMLWAQMSDAEKARVRQPAMY